MCSMLDNQPPTRCQPLPQVDEATDRPQDPPVIKSVEVLWNPFDDIVPRTTPQERQAQEQFK